MTPYLTALDASALRDAGIPAPWTFGMADRVRFGELDALNHVNNVVYLRWYETLRVNYLEDYGIYDLAGPDPKFVVKSVGLDYKELPNDVVPNDLLLLDDGRVQLKVISVNGNRVHTEVTIGGPLSNNKGINKKGGGLSADALTEKDKRDILLAAELRVDYLAVSFPRNGEDMKYARRLARDAGLEANLVAKVERAETVATIENMDDIILASDTVMVARGDLGVEIGDPELVGVQKQLIQDNGLSSHNTTSVYVFLQSLCGSIT
jgi:pyruvate kinase